MKEGDYQTKLSLTPLPFKGMKSRREERTSENNVGPRAQTAKQKTELSPMRNRSKIQIRRGRSELADWKKCSALHYGYRKGRLADKVRRWCQWRFRGVGNGGRGGSVGGEKREGEVGVWPETEETREREPKVFQRFQFQLLTDF